MIQNISNAIKAKLDTLKGVGKPFVQVYDYHTLEQTGFPYVCFELTEFEASVHDSCNNSRIFNFQVLILQDIPSDLGRQDAVQTIVKAMDDVLLAFDQDYTLGGTAIQVVPLAGELAPFVTQSGKVLIASIQLKVETLSFIH